MFQMSFLSRYGADELVVALEDGIIDNNKTAVSMYYDYFSRADLESSIKDRTEDLGDEIFKPFTGLGISTDEIMQSIIVASSVQDFFAKVLDENCELYLETDGENQCEEWRENHLN